MLDIKELEELDEVREILGYKCFAHYAEVTSLKGFRCDKCRKVFTGKDAIFKIFFVINQRIAIWLWPCGCNSVHNIPTQIDGVQS